MIWISISLFSSKQNWNRILSEAISPFVQNTIDVKGTSIAFSYLSGQNIRLALLSHNDTAAELAIKADLHFKEYFTNANLYSHRVQFPINGIFMPFPDNSVQYGLFETATLPDEWNSNLISSNFSRIMLSALIDEIDDETIITFAYYLQIAFIKVVYEEYNNWELIFMMIKKGENTPLNNEVLSMSFDLEWINEITTSILENSVFPEDLAWVNEWINICTRQLHAVGVWSANKIRLYDFYDYTMETVYNHLGINLPTQRLLSGLALYSLKKRAHKSLKI